MPLISPFGYLTVLNMSAIPFISSFVLLPCIIPVIILQFDCESVPFAGLTDYSRNLCPPGYWCTGYGPPILCPSGTKRSIPGAAAPGQCEPCTGGTFCPDPRTTGQPNVEGIPCRAGYQCPWGRISHASRHQRILPLCGVWK